MLEVVYSGSSEQVYYTPLRQRRGASLSEKLLNTWIKRRNHVTQVSFAEDLHRGPSIQDAIAARRYKNIQSTFKSHVTFHAKIRKVSNIDQFLTLGLVIFLVLW